MIHKNGFLIHFIFDIYYVAYQDAKIINLLPYSRSKMFFFECEAIFGFYIIRLYFGIFL